MAYLTSEQLQEMGFGFLGRNVRISDKASIYQPELMRIGDNSRIDDFCVISGRVDIGRYVHIAPQCLIAGGSEGVVMADFSGLAYGVKIFSQSDDYSGRSLTNPTVPRKYKNETMKKVSLGRHVIIGTNSIVFPGVSVAEGCSVGAMSLVSKSTESWGVYLGNPARRVKERARDLLELEKDLLRKL